MEDNAFNLTETALANVKKDLLQRTDANGNDYTKTTLPAELDDLFLFVESTHCAIGSLVFATIHEAYLLFIQIYERLALKADLTSSDEPYLDFYVVD